MAYQQRQQNQFGFDLANTNDSTYEEQSLNYHENNLHIRPLQSPASGNTQIMSHDESQSNYRRDSFANSAGILSPANSLPSWESKFLPPGNDRSGAMQGYRFDSDAYAQHDSNQYYNPGNYFVNQVDSGTPALFDSVPQKFDASQFQSNGQLPAHQSPPSFTPIQQEQNFKTASHVQTPMSPHSQEEWETFKSMERAGTAFPTHLRINSPLKHVEKRRGDGVRKKNAKIDIPDGRTVPVIEELMAVENDEFMLKELKGQKRLLRNREAALASRQRKKKHTEDLEVKVNNLNQFITDLEMQMHSCARQLEAERADRRFNDQRLQDATIALEGLRQEKEHLVIQHTNTTSHLRQRIRLLEDAIASSPAPAMSAAPSSTGYTDINSDLDNFTFGGPEWDKNIRLYSETDWEVVGDCRTETTIQPSKLLSGVVGQDSNKTTESDQSIPTGVLFMLLLCGAFVAANSASKTPVIPRMPDEVRAVSDTVLENLLQDMKIDVPNAASPNQVNMGFRETSGNMMSWPSSMQGGNALANMHTQLTSPTRRQLAEQASMLTPEQYNSLTQPTQYPETSSNPSSRSAPKRNLADILAKMREESIAKGSKSDVYTRSLLWNQVPDHVIKQFQQAVKDSKNELAVSPQSDQHANNMDFNAQS